jgi:hypothetical protein
MVNRKNLTVEIIAEKTWGAAFLREFELTIAANVFESMRTRETLYESVLTARVAERCMSLDQELVRNDLGLVDIPTQGENDWRSVDEALKILDDKPRGTWAVFRKDGKYDAFMSDGAGGHATRSGYKFQYNSRYAPDLTFDVLYSQTLGMAVYRTRNSIENAIVAYSATIAAIEPGTIARDKRLGGKEWGKVELLEKKPGAYVGGGDMFRVKGTTRGRRAAEYDIDASSFASIFGIEKVLPPRYQDELNAERISTLGEARQKAGQDAWDALDDNEIEGLSRLGTKGEFRRDGDAMSRPIYEEGRNEEGPSGSFEVTFAPGTAVVVDAVVARDNVPAPSF